MASQVTIKPTFLLKGIDPYELSEEYKKGESLKTLTVSKVKIITASLTSNRGTSFRDSIYAFRNKDNFLETIATTSCQTFKFVGSKDPKGSICTSCRCAFTHEPLGVPVRVIEENGVILVYRLYTTCDFRCTLRLIRDLQGRKSQTLIHSEQFLHFMYRKMYPNAGKLEEAPDPFLLESNDGSISREDYHNLKYTYIPIPNLILYPAKEQYLRLQT